MKLEPVLDALSIDRSVARNLSAFLTIFEKWNKRINLSAASNRDELTEHLIDSLHVIPHLRGHERVLDVGSGGGFPVVVAAICLPSSELVSLEPVHKKHAFIRTAARELALPNLEARAQRFEDHDARDYDVAMSRATFDLLEWITRAREYVKPSGIVIGFEAAPRDDLPSTSRRHPYALGAKSRAIIIEPGDNGAS